MENVAAMLVDKTGDGGNDALLVGATEQKDGGVLRHRFFKSFRISRAAFAPDPPLSPVPGCVPDPQR